MVIQRVPIELGTHSIPLSEWAGFAGLTLEEANIDLEEGIRQFSERLENDMPQQPEMLRIWTVEEIKNLLETNDLMVMKSLVKLFEHQTVTEQNCEETIELNHMGFNSIDASFLSSLAIQSKVFLDYGCNPWKNPRVCDNCSLAYCAKLTTRQFEVARKCIMKYAGQITKIANKVI